jgi:putative ABC transport system permease protein
MHLFALSANPDIDGLLTADYAQAAVTARTARGRVAEPRAIIWHVDFAAAATFGAAGGSSGLSGPAPTGNHVVVNQPLANALGVSAGDMITLHLGARATQVVITRVLAERGLAGAGPSASINQNVFVSPQLFSLVRPASVLGVTLVSNQGGVESGARLTDQVVSELRAALGPLARQALIDTPKRDVLQAADRTGASLGALFLMIGSFSIIAGALLLVNIFVMLGDERKTQLGMIRAVGMSRAGVAGALSLEGALYSILAVIPGVGIGIGVGWAVAKIAGVIFRSFAVSGSSLQISFAVTGTSIVNGAEMGLLIGVVAIVITSLRISRFNIIAAIRDLQQTGRSRSARRRGVAATAASVALAIAAVPTVATSQPQGSYLLPSAAAALSVPLLRIWLKPRWAVSAVAALVLVWCITLPVIRPRIFDNASMTVFVVEGTLIAASAVALVSQNQSVLLALVLRLGRTSAQTVLAIRLAGAYPLAKRFRTSATLIMYALITLVIVLLIEITGIFQATIQSQTDKVTAGFALRVDVAPGGSGTIRRIADAVGPQQPATAATTLTSSIATASDPGHRTMTALHAIAVGVDGAAVRSMSFDQRLPGLGDDAAVWQRIAHNPRYVAIDAFFGSAGGPPGHYYSPGDHFTISDPRTGGTRTVVIAGVLNSATIFYPYGTAPGASFPVIGSTAMVRQIFGRDAAVSGALLRLRNGVSVDNFAAHLQARHLAAGLVATPLAAVVRQLFSSNVAFFRLMQGFLGLGLLVGVAGIGVVMIRAVHERRRTIGMLRALGMQARTVRRSFLLESGFVAGEGVVLGGILGVVTTWLMYAKSAQFAGFHVPFPIEWTAVSVLVAVTLIASVLATVGPARRAAAIRPAIAVRVAD